MEEFHVDRPQAEQYIRIGVRLAKQAVREYSRRSGREAFVAASLGSYGATLADGSEYRGNYGVPCEQLERIHSERVRCTLLESPDMVAFETIPDAEEVKTILRLMETKFSDTPFWVSLQCRSESQLADGSNLDEISAYINELTPSSMVALGVNCVQPELVRPVVERIRSGLGSSTQILTVCYPNPGEVWEEGWRHVAGETPSPEVWSNIVVQSGADIVGGCCRTTTSHIRSLRELLY
uniref:Hcy-binding domain-containing protein n=1 Tax=Rhodosorus marinus TaxID=101924 RepID=A0A7S0BL52_9RHOD